MLSSICRLSAVTFLSLLFFITAAQPDIELPGKSETKPYKIITAGKQITIKSTKGIKHVMLWTTSGHRVVEQREINTNSYSFIIPVNQRAFYLMIGVDGGKIYTEKIGLRD